MLLAALLHPCVSSAQVRLAAEVGNFWVWRGADLHVSIRATTAEAGPVSLYGAGFRLHYDPQALDLTGLTTKSVIDAPWILTFQHVDENAGDIGLSFTHTFGAGMTLGDEQVYELTFRVRPSAPIDFGFVRILDAAAVSSSGANVLSEVQDAMFEVIETQLDAHGPMERARLEPARPNPARSRSSMGLVLTESSRVQVRLFDVGGRAVAPTLLDAELPPGRHEIPLDCRQLAPGVYVVACSVNGTLMRRVFVRQ
jgi:hypothetical protein